MRKRILPILTGLILAVCFLPSLAYADGNSSRITMMDSHALVDGVYQVDLEFSERDGAIDWKTMQEATIWMEEDLSGLEAESISQQITVTSADRDVIEITAKDSGDGAETNFMSFDFVCKQPGKSEITVTGRSGDTLTFDIQGNYSFELEKDTFNLTKSSDVEEDDNIIKGDRWDAYFSKEDCYQFDKGDDVAELFPVRNPYDGDITYPHDLEIKPVAAGTGYYNVIDVVGKYHSVKITVAEDVPAFYKYENFIGKFLYPWYVYEGDEYLNIYALTGSYNDNSEHPGRMLTTEEVQNDLVVTIDDMTYSKPVEIKNDDSSASPDDLIYCYPVPQKDWPAEIQITMTLAGKVSQTKTLAIKRNFGAGSAKLSKTTLVYNGKKQLPGVSVYVKGTDGTKIKLSSSDYTLTCAGGKYPGTHGIAIQPKTMSPYEFYFNGLLYYKIVPKGTYITSLKKGKKSFTVRWKKQSTQTSGYQIQYGLKKSHKGAKIRTVSGKSKTKATVKSLKKKKTYYVRVRTYKTVKGKKYVSSWSKTKSIRTK